MYRAPVRPQRSSAVPRPPGRFPSPAWSLPGTRSPYGASPRGCPPFSPGSPVFPGSNREYGGGSPVRFGSGGRGYRPRPGPGHRTQSGSSDSVEKYFSPSMVQDPWSSLTPVTAADAARRT
ncbi:M-phase-specific PLK1-interacting protein [Scomber japonicus]|uniref:M-phase-specific PLK1-interacting protein n=1 Tax=Scomber japonicus TaxID=13676 RepID=UPI002305B118|nr:M-phase-specific PLK1-interacting protein [Scomber japonicus]